MFLPVLSLLACAPSTQSDSADPVATAPAHDTASSAESWYPDADNDGYGDVLSEAIVASGIDGAVEYVTNNTDCDDADASRNPGTPEVCNGEDDNCDDVADNAAIDQPLWFLDLDGDGYGDSGTAVQDCDGLNHFVNNSADCNDAEITVFPGAPELCNSTDDDCDGEVDEEPTDGTTYYIDADGDGAGSAAEGAETVVACERPGFEWIPGHTDCDDTSADVNSGADELCDGVDNDCDGDVDENALDASTWFGDTDLDGYGDMYGWAVAPVRSCDQPSGYIADGTDCDDWMADVNPGATEVCDWTDNDCDGFADDDDPDGVDGTSSWYIDSDGDYAGDENGTPIEACEYGAYMSSGGWNVTVDHSDCDDSSAAIPGHDPDGDGYDMCNGECDDRNWRVNPDATETSNGYDDDCDGDVDEVE